MSAADLALAALALAAIALVGRVALSLLPPGPPGFHGVADLPVTWAASHLLGSLALVAETQLIGALGVRVSAALVLAPWALVLLVRWLTLPGGFVPRHTPRAEVGSTLSHAIAFAACVLVVASASVRHTSAQTEGIASILSGGGSAVSTSLAVANLLATLCLCNAGLRSARRAPLGRSVVIFSLSAMLAFLGTAAGDHADLTAIVLCSAGGAAFSIAWLRRADKRARMVAILSSAGAVLLGGLGWTFALALLTSLVVRTAAPTRARTAAIATLALGIAVALAFAGESEMMLRAASDVSTYPLSPPARIALAALLLVAASLVAWRIVRDSAGRARRAGNDAKIEEPRRELSALGVAAGISFASCVALGWLVPKHPSPAAIAPLLPICALMVGLALVRSERPFERA